MIELRQVAKAYGGAIALEGLNLTVNPGEFLTLLGPSGCGKTTTLRIVAGFEQPSSGEVLIAGQPVVGLPPYRRPVNTVFQHYALFPHMSVWENVAFGLRMRRLPDSQVIPRTDRALALVRLENLGHRRPRELSGGQQQRVALARALVLEPKVLLLDEPLGALDLQLRRAMQVELRQLQRQLGSTFVYVTHDQEEALAMSDRVAVMRGGRLEQLGSPEQVYLRPATRFVAQFLGEANLLEGAREEATILRWGSFTLRLAEEMPQASGVVALRPEHVQVHRPDEHVPAGANCLPGLVVERLFVGTGTRLVVDVGGNRISALVAGGQVPSPGEEIRLSFAPGHCVAVAS